MPPSPPYKDIPPAVAERIAVDFEKSIVIISSWDPAHGLLHTTTWGRSVLEKVEAANGGVIIARALGAAVEQSVVYEDFRLNEFVKLHTLRPLSEWRDDFHTVIWYKLPIDEPPYVGTPHDCDWPGYHTHWSPLPDDRLLSATDGAPICQP